ncbi:cryptochrome/photolyase family protein [Marinomonas rhizomae]|uniref:Deoxyribodipyrimidine photolyase-related protein n=1 Tax=Marinomonas rhizomae TaxID=491948 RepID=A0A366JBZ5_9GAMM|nr:cryptochrome/photolyase family protein [Marinomonas rhizomae]RBP83824.1 deoxyribodipyrimidine photolyase-related protein [Marinomonas rhizomae]RNF73467.1 cryptochrome/photolyase family protein [Marinomonas rhizomae]
MNNSYHTLRVILGDQLNATHSWFKQQDQGVLYLIAELHPEATYVTHHIQKLCAFFLAMQRFTSALKENGHDVCYLTLDDTQNQSLEEVVLNLAKQHNIDHVELQRPDEYRVLQQYHQLIARNLKPKFCMVDSEHFLLPFEDISRHFKPKHSVRMENFYRKMRQRFNVLMDENGQPEGGKWNYDSANRNKLKTKDLNEIPTPLSFQHDMRHLLERLQRHNIPSLGNAESNLLWPVTSQDALNLLAFFCENLLPNFGRFQDAMTNKTPHSWSLYHCRLSFALNVKLISPKHVIKAAVSAYHENDAIDIAQIEGFVRQILGWREYVRGMYWINMPDYQQQNELNAERDLPSYFWTGQTKMKCLASAIGQSLDYAYAHHIQRLMVTGNFCLLTEIQPQQVDEWYLGIYIDALEWVELPNTRGMSQFADGGWIASKPYAASGSYIHKMSDYCGDCHYKVKEKTSDESCPLNSLYWHFMVKHRERLGKNPRIGMIYGNWDKQNDAQKYAVLQRAEWCLENIESL